MEAIDFSKLSTFEPTYILNLHILAQIGVGILFTICAFSVASTYNAGFNVVLTSFLYFGFSAISYYVINRDKRPVFVGGVIGAGIMMIFLTLMTSIYWGQLSGCEKVDEQIQQYSCENKAGYRAVCLFSVIIFIVQFSFVIFLVNFRGEILKEASEYEEIATSPPEDTESFEEKPATNPSADL